MCSSDLQSAQPDRDLASYNDAFQEAVDGWFRLSENFIFNFGETSSSRILVEPWDTPVSAEEAAERLRDPKSYRNSHHAIPEAMATAFKTAVEKGTTIFSEVMVANIENDHHLEILRKAKEQGEIPPFLAVRLIKMKLLPEDRANALNKIGRAHV